MPKLTRRNLFGMVAVAFAPKPTRSEFDALFGDVAHLFGKGAIFNRRYADWLRTRSDADTQRGEEMWAEVIEAERRQIRNGLNPKPERSNHA